MTIGSFGPSAGQNHAILTTIIFVELQHIGTEPDFEYGQRCNSDRALLGVKLSASAVNMALFLVDAHL